MSVRHFRRVLPKKKKKKKKKGFGGDLFIFFYLLGPHLWHMEIPRLGIKSQLQLLAYTTAHSNTRSLIH